MFALEQFFCCNYKLNVAVLNKRLKTEVESKEILSDTQVGFRKARFTIDNMLILQHVIDRVENQRREIICLSWGLESRIR